MPTATARRGKSEQVEHEQRLKTASQHVHRKEAVGESVLDVSLATPLGRLSFEGKISPSEYNAGKRYAGISLRYLETIGAPYPFGPGNCPADLMPSDDECARAKRDYDGAYEALFSSGQRPAKAVKSTAVYEQDADINLLKTGLKALADYFEGVSKIVPFRPRSA